MADTLQIIQEAFKVGVFYREESDNSVRWSRTHNHFHTPARSDKPEECCANYINSQGQWRAGILNIIEFVTLTTRRDTIKRNALMLDEVGFLPSANASR